MLAYHARLRLSAFLQAPEMSGLKGKVVLVTGASSGIGAGTAEHFASLGCRVALVARNKERLEEVARRCGEAGAEETFVAAHDLAKAEECADCVEETVKRFGGEDLSIGKYVHHALKV